MTGRMSAEDYNNLQNHRLVIASSAPTEAVDPPWMKQPESERIFFSLWDQEWPSGRIFTLSFFLGGHRVAPLAHPMTDSAHEAIESPRAGTLDCFAALAMTVNDFADRYYSFPWMWMLLPCGGKHATKNRCSV